MQCKKCGNKFLRADSRHFEDAYISCPICGWLLLKGLTPVMPEVPQHPPMSSDPANVRKREWMAKRAEQLAETKQKHQAAKYKRPVVEYRNGVRGVKGI